MKRKLLLLLAGFAWFSSQGQLVNDGATIVIQPGATLFVESNFENVSGTLNNQGTMEVMGNFNNDAGSNIINAGTIKFTGSGLSTVVMAGDALNNVEVNKTGALGNVALGDPMTINGSLTFNAANTGKIVLGNHDLTLGASVLAISGAGANSYINTSVPATGQLIKTMSSASAYTFPVGDGSFYTPVTATPSGTSGSVSVAVENAAPSNLGTNPNYLTRNWRVNTTGFTSNALVGTYNQTNDVVGTEALIKGATLTGMTWSFTGSTGTPASDLVGATAPAGDVVFSGLTTIGSVKIRAYLAGAFNTGTGTMTSTLRSAVLIPPTSPYGDGATVGAMNSNVPAGVTDWVLLELTDPSNGANPVIQKAAFIKPDGFIVDLDGVSDPQILGAYNPALVRVRHRNHLSVRTLNGIDTQVPTIQDFTTNMNVYVNGAGTPMRQVVTGTWALYAGNGNGNDRINYGNINSDRTFLLGVLGNQNTTLSNQYHMADYNLSGTINYGNINSDRTTLLTNLGNQNTTIIQH
ncbi:MAG TPA: hypothetical protein PKD18_09235 [Saprospiraceae bacterium]|nr:hypothetical protein [Saprospiraceae bacterium]